MNKKIVTTLISVVGVFAVLALLMGKVYKEGQSRPPIRYSKISDNTIDFLCGLIRLGGHMMGVNFVQDGPYDWENTKDLGQKSDEGWAFEEDEFFVVYYKKDKEAVWQGYAQSVLRAANENIMPLTRLMGKYYFPQDQNGRKLPIYLANSVDEYFGTIAKLMEKPSQSDVNTSIGITISFMGNAGCKSSIVLHPICFQAPPRSPNGYVSVLMHEMNHYVFLSSLDLSKNIGFCNWQIEGLADYCADEYVGAKPQIRDSARIQYIADSCMLLTDFPDNNSNPEYWAGESYYQYLEKKQGKEFVRKFIQATYQYKTDVLFSRMDLDPEDEHDEWVKSLRTEANTVNVND